jgi:hypothetical protein
MIDYSDNAALDRIAVEIDERKDIVRPPAFTDDALALGFADEYAPSSGMSPRLENGLSGMAVYGVPTIHSYLETVRA